MQVILAIIAALACAIVFFQDLRAREIWWFLPAVVFTAIYFAFKIETRDLLSNLIFICLLAVLLVLYVRIRFNTWELFRSYFGIGDLLFLLAITPLLPPPFFIWFFTAATCLSLILYMLRRSAHNGTIPYAGYLSISCVAVIIIRMLNPQLLSST